MSERRIVILAGHVIAQWHDGTGWWTASKASNNDESDFAMWPSSEESVRKAMRVIGDVPIVRATRAPLQRGSAWYTDGQDHTAKSYNEALRALARAL